MIKRVYGADDGGGGSDSCGAALMLRPVCSTTPSGVNTASPDAVAIDMGAGASIGCPFPSTQMLRSVIERSVHRAHRHPWRVPRSLRCANPPSQEPEPPVMPQDPFPIDPRIGPLRPRRDLFHTTRGWRKIDRVERARCLSSIGRVRDRASASNDGER